MAKLASSDTCCFNCFYKCHMRTVKVVVVLSGQKKILTLLLKKHSSQSKMPLTPAEKMRRYRERLKENPETMEEQRIRNLERITSKYLYKSVKEMSEDEKRNKDKL